MTTAGYPAILATCVLALGTPACTGATTAGPGVAAAPIAAADTPTTLRDPREIHLRNVRQLTFGGQNAEAYFAFDGKRLIYQSTPEDHGCDQIYVMNLDGSDRHRVSTGAGRTTCSYFYPSGHTILYASTQFYGAACPTPPDFSRGYVWSISPAYDIFVANEDGSNVERLTTSFGYDAEATFSPRGDRIVFTSMRDGDLEIYTMAPDGSDVRRLTHEPGYDGGPFFSPDGTQIIYRAHHPAPGPELDDYRGLLAEGLIRPGNLDLWVMDADGSNKRQVTDVPGASFAPFWHPSGRKVIFASNMNDPRGREFDLFMVNLDGSGLERVTFTDDFDGFPVFSPDGSKLVWASNRNGKVPGETNIFIADWVD